MLNDFIFNLLYLYNYESNRVMRFYLHLYWKGMIKTETNELNYSFQYYFQQMYRKLEFPFGCHENTCLIKYERQASTMNQTFWNHVQILLYVYGCCLIYTECKTKSLSLSPVHWYYLKYKNETILIQYLYVVDSRLSIKGLAINCWPYIVPDSGLCQWHAALFF